MSLNKLTGRPLRIAVGPSDLGTHLQAQAQLPDGKWEWLGQRDFGVGAGCKDIVRGFEIKQYVTVEQLPQKLGYVGAKRVPSSADNETIKWQLFVFWLYVWGPTHRGPHGDNRLRILG